MSASVLYTAPEGSTGDDQFTELPSVAERSITLSGQPKQEAALAHPGAIWSTANIHTDDSRRRRRWCMCCVLWVCNVLVITAATILLWEIISAKEHILVLDNRKDHIGKRTSTERPATVPKPNATMQPTTKSFTISTNSIFIPFTGTPPSDNSSDSSAEYDYMNPSGLEAMHHDHPLHRQPKPELPAGGGRRRVRDLAGSRRANNQITRSRGGDNAVSGRHSGENAVGAPQTGSAILQKAARLLEQLLSQNASARWKDGGSVSSERQRENATFLVSAMEKNRLVKNRTVSEDELVVVIREKTLTEMSQEDLAKVKIPCNDGNGTVNTTGMVNVTSSGLVQGSTGAVGTPTSPPTNTESAHRTIAVHNATITTTTTTGTARGSVSTPPSDETDGEKQTTEQRTTRKQTAVRRTTIKRTTAGRTTTRWTTTRPTTRRRTTTRPTTRRRTTTKKTTTTATKKPLKPCFKKWIRWKDHCYKTFQWRVAWDQAKKQCQKRKSNIASVHSEAENHFLMGRYGPVCYKGQCRAITGIHIGLNDKAREGRYVWTDGSPVKFLNWSKDEPSNSPPPYGDRHGEDCTELRVVFGFGQWNDISCTTVLRPFVCKAPVYEHLRRFGH